MRVTEYGIEYEPDPRHAELIVEELNLQNAKSVMTLGEKMTNEESPKLSATDVTRYRSICARTNYLAQDRADITYIAKELCRRMSNPTEADWQAMKRMGRYLKGRPRMIQYFGWQAEGAELEVNSDTDHAGCTRTRKSTSGGCILYGSHCMRFWSKTQAGISLSSAESELTGVVKATTEAIGMMALMKDLGVISRAVVAMDSSAALGMVGRQGLGKVRHLDVNKLWLQQRTLREEVQFKKVLGAENPADAFTKPLDQKLIDEHMSRMGFQCSEGRADIAVQLNMLSAMMGPEEDDEDGEHMTVNDECRAIPRMISEYREFMLQNSHWSNTQFTPNYIGK